MTRGPGKNGPQALSGARAERARKARENGERALRNLEAFSAEVEWLGEPIGALGMRGTLHYAEVFGRQTDQLQRVDLRCRYVGRQWVATLPVCPGYLLQGMASGAIFVHLRRVLDAEPGGMGRRTAA